MARHLRIAEAPAAKDALVTVQSVAYQLAKFVRPWLAASPIGPYVDLDRALVITNLAAEVHIRNTRYVTDNDAWVRKSAR